MFNKAKSSNTNNASRNRLEQASKLQQSNPGDLLDENVWKLHSDWQNCNPDDAHFWRQLAECNTEQRSQALIGRDTRNQQMGVLSK